jgi:ABC-type sugar transport system ATPase subunit
MRRLTSNSRPEHGAVWSPRGDRVAYVLPRQLGQDGGLNPAERTQMIELIRTVAKTGNQSGVTILMIEHVMKAVQALADRILVIHHGQQIAEGPPSKVLRDRKVIEVYLGNVMPVGTEPASADAGD